LEDGVVGSIGAETYTAPRPLSREGCDLLRCTSGAGPFLAAAFRLYAGRGDRCLSASRLLAQGAAGAGLSGALVLASAQQDRQPPHRGHEDRRGDDRSRRDVLFLEARRADIAPEGLPRRDDDRRRAPRRLGWGGLCQLSNALYWVALHLGCTISERHRHSFDCFPDSYRSVPFGAGATVNYNYVDLRFLNDSEETFLFAVRLDDEYLHVEAFADREPRNHFRVIEENHRFADDGQVRWRENDLYRLRLRGDELVAREHLAHNRGRVLYDDAER